MDDFAPDTIHTGQIFKGLDLSHARIVANEFETCAFKHCLCTAAAFEHCRFVSCVFEDCDLSLVSVADSTFSNTRFRQSRLAGVNWTAAKWRKGRFYDAIAFEACALNHATFIGLELSGLRLKDCVAIDVDFREANLARADFTGSDLEHSLFLHTNLAGADFTGARNYAINAGVNTLQGAKFALPEAMALLYHLDIELQE